MACLDAHELCTRRGTFFVRPFGRRDHGQPSTPSRRERRLAAATAAVLLLSACSENVAIFATNPCPETLTMTVADSVTERQVEVPPGRTVEIWAICCEPGQAGRLELRANGWQQTISYAELRDEPILMLPSAVCPR